MFPTARTERRVNSWTASTRCLAKSSSRPKDSQPLPPGAAPLVPFQPDGPRHSHDVRLRPSAVNPFVPPSNLDEPLAVGSGIGNFRGELEVVHAPGALLPNQEVAHRVGVPEIVLKDSP